MPVEAISPTGEQTSPSRQECEAAGHRTEGATGENSRHRSNLTGVTAEKQVRPFLSTRELL